MRTNTHPFIASFLLLFLFIFHTNLSARTRPKKIDPIRFTITTDASYLSANEEFEIKITAKYLSINPNLVYVFDGANAFKLKLIMPDGFKQTGGTYSDFVGAELTSSKPSVTYTVKGKFASDTQGGTFQLLRSHRSAGNQSEFVQVGALAFTTISQPTDTVSAKNARIAVVNPDYVSYMTLSEFRTGAADSSNVIYLNEGVKSGTFKFDPSNTTAVDDSSMVLIHSSRRYFREDLGYLRPEWFGATGDGTTNDYVAIQKTFNYVSTHGGAKVIFGAKTYLTGQTIQLKSFTNATPYNYNISLSGAGLSVTTIQGTESFSGNLLEMTKGQFNFAGRTNNVLIENLTLRAKGASRSFYANYFANLRFQNIFFQGGENVSLQLGTTDNTNQNYSVYLSQCYFQGIKKNGHMNGGCLIAEQNLFLSIDRMETDGGKYGIFLKNSAGSTITGSKIEGSKKAAIYIEGVGNGEHKIIGNYFVSYGGFDENGVFDGTAYGIYIKGNNAGSSANNTIIGNTFRIAGSSAWPVSMTYTALTNTHVSANGDVITGATSGAVGYLQGIDVAENRIVVQIVSGTFVNGEDFTHTYNGAPAGTGKIGVITQTKTYGIKSESNFTANIIQGNTFTDHTDYAMHITSGGDLISNNTMSGVVGIYINKAGVISNNNFYNATPWINDGGLATISGNIITAGTVSGSQNVMKGGLDVNGTSSFSGGDTDISNLKLSGDVFPKTASTINIGSPSYPLNNIHGYTYKGTIFQAINPGGLIFATQSGAQHARMVSSTGNFILGPGNPTDNGNSFQVNGNSSFSGTVSISSLPVYADNTAASSGGLAVGALYRTSTGDIKVRY